MNICYVIADPEIGGSEKHILSLAREAKKSGHKVSFVLGRKGPLIKELQITNDKLQILKMESSFNPFSVLKSIFALRKYFRDKKIDIVHTHMLREHSLSIGAKFLGAKVKVIRSFHRLDQFNFKMLPLLWFYRLETDAFIVATKYVENYLSENGIKNKVQVIENGVPSVISTETETCLPDGQGKQLTPREYSRQAIDKEDSLVCHSALACSELVESDAESIQMDSRFHGNDRRGRQDGKPKPIGFLGRIVPEKGIANFITENIDLFQKENDFKLIVGGTGPDLEKLKIIKPALSGGRMGKKLKSIEILGQVTDLKEFFEKIAVLILPSETEVMPLVVLEAYSAGVPVVTFDLESLKEVVPAVAGIRIPAYDHRKMAEEAIGLIENQGLLAKMSKDARKLYNEKYTIEAMWLKTEKLYKELLA